MADASESDARTPAALAPAVRPAVVAAATFALGFGIGLRQLARSNRPHELTAAPCVAALLAVALAFTGLTLRRLDVSWRERREHPLTLGHRVLAVLMIPFTAILFLLLFAAVGTALEIHFGTTSA